jgi:hypothetical protein
MKLRERVDTYSVALQTDYKRELERIERRERAKLQVIALAILAAALIVFNIGA